MDSSQINVNWGNLQAGAATWQTASREVVAAYEAVKAAWNPLVETWVAAGSESGQLAQQALEKWRAGSEEFSQLLQRASQITTQVHDDQFAMEKKIAGTFQA